MYWMGKAGLLNDSCSERDSLRFKRALGLNRALTIAISPRNLCYSLERIEEVFQNGSQITCEEPRPKRNSPYGIVVSVERSPFSFTYLPQ